MRWHKMNSPSNRVHTALFNRFLRLPFEMLFPPGYLSAKSLANMRSHKRSVSGQEHTVDSLIEAGIIICGSPDTVRRRFTETHRLLGFQNLLCLMQFGTLPRDLTERNIRLFAKEVMPALQALTDKEYQRMRTGSINVLREVLDFMVAEQVAEVAWRGDSDIDVQYQLTSAGKQRASAWLERCAYSGPAPVTLEATSQGVRRTVTLTVLAPG